MSEFTAIDQAFRDPWAPLEKLGIREAGLPEFPSADQAAEELRQSR